MSPSRLKARCSCCTGLEMMNPCLFRRVSLMEENVMDPWRYVDRVPPFLRGRAFVAGSLVVFSLLPWVTGGHAQQGQRPQAHGSAIPTLEALPHTPLPRDDFQDWCGLNDSFLMR